MLADFEQYRIATRSPGEKEGIFKFAIFNDSGDLKEVHRIALWYKHVQKLPIEDGTHVVVTSSEQWVPFVSFVSNVSFIAFL